MQERKESRIRHVRHQDIGRGGSAAASCELYMRYYYSKGRMKEDGKGIECVFILYTFFFLKDMETK